MKIGAATARLQHMATPAWLLREQRSPQSGESRLVHISGSD